MSGGVGTRRVSSCILGKRSKKELRYRETNVEGWGEREERMNSLSARFQCDGMMLNS